MNADLSNLPNALERAMQQAAQGDQDATRSFFHLLLAAEIFVPERFQDHAMSDAPAYPNQFINFLGVRAGERVIVPLFTRAELIEEWAGARLKSRKIATAELLKRIPEEWWLCLNPGLEVEKEISPWEIAQLVMGAEGIEDIVLELCSEDPVGELELSVPNGSEFEILKTQLSKMAEQYPAIQKMYLLLGSREDLEGVRTNRILLGAETQDADSGNRKAIQGAIKNICDLCRIGDTPVRVLVEDHAHGQLVGLFNVNQPFYEKHRKTGLLGAISALIGRKPS